MVRISRFRTEYGEIEYLSVFSPSTGVYGPEKTPYKDTCRAVSVSPAETIF